MRREHPALRAACALLLTYTMLWGSMPVPALAEMAEEAVEAVETYDDLRHDANLPEDSALQEDSDADQDEEVVQGDDEAAQMDTAHAEQDNGEEEGPGVNGGGAVYEPTEPEVIDGGEMAGPQDMPQGTPDGEADSLPDGGGAEAVEQDAGGNSELLSASENVADAEVSSETTRRKSSLPSFRLHTWISKVEFGDSLDHYTEPVRLGDTVWLNFDFVDENWNTLYPSQYGKSATVKFYIYGPSGNLLYELDEDTTDRKCVGLRFNLDNATGQYRFRAEVGGDFVGSCEATWVVQDIFRLHTWISKVELGDSLDHYAEPVRLGDTVYVNYDFVDYDWNTLYPSQCGRGVNAKYYVFDPCGNIYTSGEVTCDRYSLPITHSANGSTGNYRFYVEVSGGITSSCEAGWSVYDSVPSITAQPTNRTALSGNWATFSVSATGSHLSYQWYSMSPLGSVTCITDAKSSSYSVVASASNSGTRYYCLITNNGNSVWSSKATLTTQYAITYDANGGSGTIAEQRKTHGTPLTLSSQVPSWSGHTFLGWSTSSSASSATYSAGGAFNIDATTKLYAVWRNDVKSLSSCTATLSPSSYVYDGTQKNPTITVKDGSKTLSQGVDYHVSSTPSGRTNVGTYTYALAGKGGYTGAASVSFTISRANPTLTFSSTSVTKKTTDAAFTNTLTKVTDGTVMFTSSNTNVATVNGSTGQVAIKGAGQTTITASATTGTNYKADSASYTLTVTNAVYYTVQYNANGGTGTPSTQTKEQNISLELSGIKPSKAYTISYNSCGGSVSPASKSVNCTFRNWNTKKDGSGASYASGASYTANADATLYAQWENPKAGTLATPIRSGYDFVGWFTSATGGSLVSSTTTVTGSMALYAHWTDSYNLGDETYSFPNYRDDDATGHCFGMSMTSAGYHNNLLDIGMIGGNANTPLYSFDETTVVKRPICHYTKIQDHYRDDATVAGGSWYLTGTSDLASDWNAIVNYVKNHSYDNTGLLQIGYRGRYSYYGTIVKAGHAINFLRYEKVDGQDRIYAYDNNCPNEETYFYRSANGNVLQAPYQTFDVAIDCIALRDVRTYFNNVEDYDETRVLYMEEDAASVQGYIYSHMEGTIHGTNRVMYVLPVDTRQVTIVPYRDNADFVYLDTEYSFGDVSVLTRGKLTLASNDEGAAGSGATFTIYELNSTIPTVALSKERYTYDGSIHKPVITVKSDGMLLKETRDYDVKYPSGMVNAGEYEIRVTLKGDYSGEITKTFTIEKAAQSITAANKSVAMGKTVSLDAKCTKGNGKLTYASSNTAVAKVSSAGVVTPVKVGTCKVTITAAATANWNKATKTVTITVTKGTQTITATNKSVAMGKTVSLGAKRTKGDGKLTYATSNAKVAKVSAAGVVTPVKVGACKVTITAAATANWNKATKTVTITVTKAAQPMTAKAANRTASLKTLRTKAVTVARPIAIAKAQGKLSYAKVASGSSAALTVNKTTGKVTVRKGTKKGTYTIKIKVTAAGNTNYKAGSKTVTCKVVVK